MSGLRFSSSLSGGQSDQIAHVPELRFALGEPEIDTTSIDNAASSSRRQVFRQFRKAGTDGYRFDSSRNSRKSFRSASVTRQAEIKKAIEKMVEGQFRAGATLNLRPFSERQFRCRRRSPAEPGCFADPDEAWTRRSRASRKTGAVDKVPRQSARLYPASIIWCLRKQGEISRDRVEDWLAWQRVQKEISEGALGSEFETVELKEVTQKVRGADEEARDEVWASYRFIAFAPIRSVGSGLRLSTWAPGTQAALSRSAIVSSGLWRKSNARAE